MYVLYACMYLYMYELFTALSLQFSMNEQQHIKHSTLMAIQQVSVRVWTMVTTKLSIN